MHYKYDVQSEKIARILQEHFEYELAHSPNTKSAQFKKNAKANEFSEDMFSGSEGESEEEGDDDDYSVDKKGKKKKGSKKKGRDDKKKKGREDDESDALERKQRLFELITEHMTTEQKKGIIPIVFESNKDNPSALE
mmetsp:Transcript_8514/g.13101  ORF Transcript_8514/g.13101 Transcript_8514/m.13101 type:complete len:137 (+) Transcript_8514:1571-1981(+)